MLRAALVTPLTGPLALYGRATAHALRLWAAHAADLFVPGGVALDVIDCHPDAAAAMRTASASRPDLIFGPYGSSPTHAAAGATGRTLWNHGGASGALRWPDHPNVLNVLSPATSYFRGTLDLVRAADPPAVSVVAVHTGTRFGREVVGGAVAHARACGLRARAVGLSPGADAAALERIPPGDVLLVAGGFRDELSIAQSVLDRSWRAAGFVGAGVKEVLADLGDRRDGLLGPAQWVASAALAPDEGPDASWFVDRYVAATGAEPAYPAAQAFAAGVLAARCLRDAGATDDAALLAAARGLSCRTLFGGFRLDPSTGVQVGHEVLTVQWQDGARRVVWPRSSAQSDARLPLDA